MKVQIERIGYISNEISNNGGIVIFYSGYPYFNERETIKKLRIRIIIYVLIYF